MISGSGLSAANDIMLDAGRDVNMLAALNNQQDREQNTRERVGVEVKSSSNSVDAFAGREQLTVTGRTDSSSILATGLQAGNDITVKAGGDITQSGSDVAALNDIGYTAEGNIRLDVTTVTQQQQSDEVLRRDGLSSSFVYDYASTREAVRNAGEGDNAISRDSSTLQAVDSVNNFVSGPSANLFAGNTTSRSSQTTTTEQVRGSSVQAGGSVNLNAGKDIDIAASAVIADIDVNLDAENIDIHAEQTVSSQSARSRFDQDGATMTGQRGSASVGVMTSFNRQQSTVSGATTQSSLISAGRNAQFTARTDIRVTGSDINVENDTTFKAGNDVLIQAAAVESSLNQKGNSGGAGTGIAVTGSGSGGAAVGVYVSGNAGRNRLERTGVEYRNSQVTSGNRLTIISGGDTTLKGANAEADQVALDIGGDLTIASVQDTGNVSGEQQDISARVVGGAGASVSASVGKGSTSGSKAWVNQQTALIARDRLEGSVAGHTQLDGAVLASQTGNMEMETGSFGYSDISDIEQERSSYLNVGISSSDSQTAGAIQQQNNRDTGLPVASGQSSGGAGITVSGNRSTIDRAQINRATLGGGSLIVRGDQPGDASSLAGINRDLDQAQQITRDESSDTQIYASDSAINAVQNPVQTAASWLQGLDNYAIGSLEMYQFMGKAGDLAAQEADTPFESIMASLASGMVDATNLMGTVTLGLAPTVANHGGAASQVAALAVGDQQFRRIKVQLENDPKTSEVQLAQIEQDTEVALLNQGETVSTNGMLNTFEEAVRNASMQSNSEEFVLAYNPTHGIAGDIIESAWDYFIGDWLPSGNARDLNQFYKKNIDKNISFNIVAHSQGGLLNLRAIDGLDFSNNGKITTGTVMFSGAPVNSQVFYKTMTQAGFSLEDAISGERRVVFQTNRTNRTGLAGTVVVDSISELLGGNYNYGDNSGFWSSVFSLGSLFSETESPHSNYLCRGATCGGRNIPVLDAYRSSEDYIESTVIEYQAQDEEE